jgi:hypothetical protein
MAERALARYVADAPPEKGNVRMREMKRHIGKLIGLLGILMLYPLSGVLAPWVTRTFFSQRMPDGQSVVMNLNAGVKGVTVCLFAGALVLLVGIAIEVVQFVRRRERNPNPTSEGIRQPADGLTKPSM